MKTLQPAMTISSGGLPPQNCRGTR